MHFRTSRPDKTIRKIIILVSLLVLPILDVTRAQDAIEAHWRQITGAETQVHASRSQHASTFTNRALYVFGGIRNPQTSTPSASVFHIDTNIWEDISKGEDENMIGHSAVSIENQILLYGGLVPSRRPSEVSQTLQSFNVDDQKWNNVSLCDMCFAGPLAGHSAVSVGQQLFIFGGNDGHKDRNDLFMYDFGLGSWEKIDSGVSGPPARRDSIMFACNQSHIIVFGGKSLHNELSDLWRYSIAGRTWERLSTDTENQGEKMKSVHSGSGFCLDDTPFWIIFGGRQAGALSNQLVAYDMRMRRFDRTLVDIQSRVRPSPRQSHSVQVASVEHQDLLGKIQIKAYLIGGSVSDSDLVDDSAYELDMKVPLVQDRVSPSRVESTYLLLLDRLQLFEGPSERFSGAMAIRDGQLYYFGGEAPGIFFSDTLYSDLYVISLRDFMQRRPVWRSIKSNRNSPLPRSGHSLTSVDAVGGLVVFGGLASEGWTPIRPSNQIHILSADTLQWKSIDLSASESQPMKRAYHAAVSIRQSTQLFVFGGKDGMKNGEFFDDCWILDFTSAKWLVSVPTGASPAARAGHTLIYDEPSNSIILFGGQGKSSLFNDVHILNNVGMLSSAWGRIFVRGPSPEPRHSHAAFFTTLHDVSASSAVRAMIVLGGINEKDEILSDAWALDIDTKRWHHLATPQGYGLANAAFAATSAGSVLVIGTGRKGSSIDNAKMSTEFFTLTMSPIPRSNSDELITVESQLTHIEPAVVEAPKPIPVVRVSQPRVEERDVPPTHPHGASPFEAALDYYMKSKDTLTDHKSRLVGTQTMLTSTETAFSEKIAPLLSKQPENEASLLSWFDSTSDIAEELAKRRSTAASKMEIIRNALTELDKAELQISTLKRVNATLSQQFSILRASKVGLDSIRLRLRDAKDSFLGLVKDEEEIVQHLAELYTQDIANAQHSDRVQKQELERLKDEHQKIDSETQVTQSGIRQLEFETADAVELIKRVEANLAGLPARISALEAEEAAAKAKISEVDRQLEERQSGLQQLLKKKRKLETQLEHISQREALIQELAILTNEQRKSRELVARGLKSVNSIKQRADKVLRSIELGVVDPETTEVEQEAVDNDLTHDDLQAFEAQLGFDVDNQLATELESKTAELEQISSEIQSRILQHRTTIINQLHQVEEQIRSAEAFTKELRQRKTRLEDDFADKTRKLRQELDLKQKHQSDRDRLSSEYGQKQTQIEQKRGKLESLRAQATQCFVRINSIEDEIRQRDSATKQRREQIISKVEKWKSVRWRLAEAEQQVFRVIEELKEAQNIYLQRWSKMSAEQKEGEKAHFAATKTIQRAVESTTSLDSVRIRMISILEKHVEELFHHYKDSDAGKRAADIEAAVERMISHSRETLHSDRSSQS